MHLRTGTIVLAVTLCFAGAAHAQSWEAASSSGAVSVEWSLADGAYTFRLISSAEAETSVIAWTLQPFNIPQPVSVACPDGWKWESKGGWNRFTIVDQSARYEAGGPSAEPGEALVFVYRPVEGTKPVNRGGPESGSPAFLSHVGAVNGMDSGRWIPAETPLGTTWFDGNFGTEIMLHVPEPGSIGALTLGFLAVLRLARKSRRV